jgi:hypothetical protein
VCSGVAQVVFDRFEDALRRRANREGFLDHACVSGWRPGAATHIIGTPSGG